MSRERYDPLAVLGRHDGGRLADDIREQMQGVVRDVTRYGGTGKLTIEIVVKPNGENGVEITPAVKATRPKRTTGKAFFYPDAEGDLFRAPPEDEADQLLRPVPSGVAKA